MTKAKKAVRKAKPKMKILPMVMSKLIGIALADMRKAERQPKKYVIDMGDWYQPNAPVQCKTDNNVVIAEHTICAMCAAGSVMAFTLASTRQKKGTMVPDNFDGNTRQLEAIDSLRRGSAYGAHNALTGDFENPMQKLDHGIPKYFPMNPEPFHKAMKAFQKKLQKAGY